MRTAFFLNGSNLIMGASMSPEFLIAVAIGMAITLFWANW